ncbi:MAG: hypothetical protein WAT53_08040 [Nitrosomonas sp.]|nr:hypothetical protein [Nitrosomonas sp.]
MANTTNNGWENLGKREEIRRLLAQALATNDDNIDLVDLYRGGLGINATVVDEGIPLTGQNNLALANFYQSVWVRAVVL